MHFYLIHESLSPCTLEDITVMHNQYAAVLSSEEYVREKHHFNMGIDIDQDLQSIHNTMAIVNYDSLTGSFNIPDHETYSDNKFKLAFALDEKGIVFIDDDDYTYRVLEKIRTTRRWKLPSLERFIFDFLEETIVHDPELLENVEHELSLIEISIMKGDMDTFPSHLNEIRSDLLDLYTHYAHLIDLAQEFEENENDFFQEENLRYFRLFADRVKRLQDTVSELRSYIIQLRDLSSEQLSIKQNKIITYLTIVTTVFMPLTLIVGWYGMNFRDMPELYSPFGYPTVIILSIMIVVGLLTYFKKKKWL